ncbi:hypothetical protein GGU45_000712 [Niabella hirudinis]
MHKYKFEKQYQQIFLKYWVIAIETQKHRFFNAAAMARL